MLGLTRTTVLASNNTTILFSAVFRSGCSHIIPTARFGGGKFGQLFSAKCILLPSPQGIAGKALRAIEPDPRPPRGQNSAPRHTDTQSYVWISTIRCEYQRQPTTPGGVACLRWPKIRPPIPHRRTCSPRKTNSTPLSCWSTTQNCRRLRYNSRDTMGRKVDKRDRIGTECAKTGTNRDKFGTESDGYTYFWRDRENAPACQSSVFCESCLWMHTSCGCRKTHRLGKNKTRRHGKETRVSRFERGNRKGKQLCSSFCMPPTPAVGDRSARGRP